MEQRAYLQLQAARGIGPATQHKIFAYISDHQLKLSAFMSQSKTDWINAGLSEKQAAALTVAENLAEEWSLELSRRKVRVIGWLDEEYPRILKANLGKVAPPILSMWGNMALLDRPSVGFSGARNASELGLSLTNEIAGQIASNGRVIISGHASGIDNAAHLAALENRGSTIIIAPTGILNFRLRSKIKAIMKMEEVLIISEFQPNSQWSIGNAMTRNKTICGLSDVLVIVEPGKTGGTHEAGKFALKTEIPLYVAAAKQVSEYDGFFIDKGAKLIQPAKDTGDVLLDVLNLDADRYFEKKKQQSLSGTISPSKEARQPRLL